MTAAAGARSDKNTCSCLDDDGLLRTHLHTFGRVVAGGRDLHLLRPSPMLRAWTIYTTDAKTSSWLTRHQLTDARFTSLRDTLRTLSALHVLDPIPAPPRPVSAPRLIRVRAGHHRSADHTYTVVRRDVDPGKSWWDLYAGGVFLGSLRGLHEVRDAIINHEALGT